MPKVNKDRYKEIRNSKAHRDFFVEDTLECGLVLTGTEVKSIRMGQAQITDSFVRLERQGPVLYHCHIAEYAFGSYANHAPYRPRKLLMHQKEIRKWTDAVKAAGKTIVPLKMYFKKGLVKVQIGLCKGKKEYDKREDLKEKVDLRETQRMVRHHL